MAQRRNLACRPVRAFSAVGALVAVPVLLAVAALLMSGCDTATGLGPFRSSELAAKSYRDDMEALIAEEGLAESEPGSEVRQRAHERTVEALEQIDRDRREDAMRFLSDAMMLQSAGDSASAPIVSLQGANLHGSDGSGTDLSRLSLTGADLSEADLRNVDLSGAILEAADLHGAKLDDADLAVAWLFAANLRDGELSAADLRGAELTGADLSQADLSNADLCGANLRGADLSGARLEGTLLAGADLTGTDLSGTQGLTQLQLQATASYTGANGLDDLGLRPDTRPTSTAHAGGAQ